MESEFIDEARARARVWAKAYSALMRDRRITHGEFRLWHCLNDHLNSITGKCFPGQRTISKEIGCDTHSLKDWTATLESAGWLRIMRSERGRGFHYVLLDGKGHDLPL